MEGKDKKDTAEDMNSFQKAWEVLFPYLLYYLAYSGAYIMLAFLQEVLDVLSLTGGEPADVK